MKKYCSLLIFWAMLGSNAVFGQLALNEPVNKPLNKNILVQADRYFEREAYGHAVDLYRKILTRDPQQQEVMLKAAYCYDKLNEHHNAAFWYKSAMKLEPRPSSIWLDFADCQKRLGNYQLVAETYREYLRAFPNDRLVENWLKELNSISQAKHRAVQISKLDIDLPGPVFAPSFWQNGLVVVAQGNNRRLAKAVGTWSEQPYYDLYYLPLTSQQGQKAKYLSHRINSLYHEGPAVFYQDGKRIIFTRSSNQKSQQTRQLKLMTSKQKKNGKWTKAKPLKINQKNVSMGHPALSLDGKTLYFVSNAPGGHGGADIYKSQWAAGAWQQPVNLGPQVNSAGDELFPTINGVHLFYSSDGKGGFGGQDIWIYSLQGSSQSQNAGAPFNSNADDFGLIWHQQDGKGYFSSNRSGKDAIYKVSR